MAEWVDSLVGERACDEVEGEVEVGEREVGEHELDELIDEFDMKEDLPAYRVIRPPDLFEMDERVDSCEESSVEPSSTLGNEFGNGIYGVLETN